VPYYGATGQVGTIDEALFDEELCLLGEDGAPFLDRSKPKAYVINGPAWVNNHAHVLRARTGVTTNRYLKHTLDWIDYRPHVRGTTRLKLTKGALSAINLPLPPRDEQGRIVAAIEEQFSCLDAADESLRTAERRTVVMRSAVGAAAVGGDFPTVLLGDVADSMRYGTSVKCHVDADGPPVLRIPNVRGGGGIDITDLKFASVERSDLGDCFVEPGDLLFVRTNGSRDLIGRVAVVQDDTRPAFASYLIRARPDRARVHPGWLVLALSSPATRALIESRAATTAGQYNLNLQSLRSLPVPLPSFEEQERRIEAAAAEMSRLDAMSASIAAARRRSAALRRSILERAFRGELVPQDPSDEAASVLLERIRTERAAAGPTRRRSSRATARSGHTAGTSGG
jgi:type I restriction enzyme S subunit